MLELSSVLKKARMPCPLRTTKRPGACIYFATGILVESIGRVVTAGSERSFFLYTWPMVDVYGPQDESTLPTLLGLELGLGLGLG